MISTFKGPREKLFDLKFDPSGSNLVAATKSEIYLISNGKISKATGWGPKTSNKQCTMCVGFSGNETVVGCLDGKILRMRAGSISYGLAGHKACVNAIWSRSSGNGFISGGSDGKIIVWDSAFTQSNVIDLSSFKDIPIMNPRVRAVSESPDGKRIVIGTRSSNIIEVDLAGGSRKCVNYGHFDKELWGLAVIPKSDEVVTCGEDFMLAKWDLKNRKMIRMKRIPFMAKVCDVASNGQMMAVGCVNGKVLILNTTDFSSIKEFSSGTKEISEVKFSPDNKMIAVGSHDSRIRIYLTNGFKLYSECKKNLSTVTHLDWSTNSQVLQSNSTSYEILYFTADGKQVTSGASAYKDELWASWNCVIGWPVQGIWPKFADGTDVNAVARNKDRTILATADDFGTVKLFKYPCVVEKALNNEFIGHSSHVTNVRFSDKEDFIISTGGNDKSIIEWAFLYGNGTNVAEEEVEGEVDDDGFVESDLSTVPQDEHLRPRDQKPGKNEGPAMYGDFQIEENDDGDQALAVKPFLGEIEPSKPRDYKPDPQGHLAPAVNLTLQHAFGFRCFDAKDSAKFGQNSNTCVFITAALGVSMNITNNQQSFFNMHDEDLVSMDVTPDKRFCATGSMPAKGRSKKLDIYVWDTVTMQKQAFLTGFLTGAVKHLKFSPNGNYLVGVGQDENNSLAVYDWRNQTLVCTSKVEKSPVFDCDWSDDNNLVTVGKDFIKFFRISNGSCSGTKGSWGKMTRVALASCKFVKNVCFSGTWNGQIIPWNGTSCGKPVAAHTAAVFCLHYNKNKDQLLSGGKDGMIYSWRVNGDTLQKIAKLVDCQADYPSCYGGVRSIDTHEDGSILFGTRSADLIKTSHDGSNGQAFMSGHYEGELWGLACHPTEPWVVTAGDDKSIRIYDCVQKEILQMYYNEANVRAVDWSSDAELIVTASMTGEIALFSNELDKLFSLTSGFVKKGTDQWIEEIKFSPDCQMVAFGSHGGYSPVEIMLVKDKTLAKFASVSVGFTSALLHLDWSNDSNFIVCNSQAAELKFLNVKGQKQMRSSDTKDIKWQTWTCKFGFPVQGIWAGVDYTDVNTVCRSENQKYLATGEDSQKIKLFKYPCVKEKSQFKSYIAHSSHVTRVRFMLKDNLLVSIGGNDKTLCVWRTDFGDSEARSKLEKQGNSFDSTEVE